MKALITDVEGERLTAEERAFLKKTQPYGIILFARNCMSPLQVQALTAELRDTLGRELPILIDQEGGRVARLKPPHWREASAASDLAALPQAREAIYLNARLLAHELHGLGINVDCAPVADLRLPGAHDIIGGRAYGDSPARVAELAGSMAEGLMDGGVIPVVKHIPGHGRAKADSHFELPVVDTSFTELNATDFEVFKRLRELPMAMTAHVVYSDIDPKRCATVSPEVVRIIREEIGFDGLLMSDAIDMKAMQGSLAERAQAVLAAGCDVVLHCNGTLDERKLVADACAKMSTRAQERSERAFHMANAQDDGFTPQVALARLNALMAQAA